VAALHLDEPLKMFNELQQLQIYITPDMNVYKNLISTGMDQLMFKQDFLMKIQLLEEMLFVALNGHQSNEMTEEQTKGKNG
jgi:hypothetical protein